MTYFPRLLFICHQMSYDSWHMYAEHNHDNYCLTEALLKDTQRRVLYDHDLYPQAHEK